MYTHPQESKKNDRNPLNKLAESVYMIAARTQVATSHSKSDSSTRDTSGSSSKKSKLSEEKVRLQTERELNLTLEACIKNIKMHQEMGEDVPQPLLKQKARLLKKIAALYASEEEEGEEEG